MALKKQAWVIMGSMIFSAATGAIQFWQLNQAARLLA
jgi:hypothetical protein